MQTIPGVTVIELGVAKGHGLIIDETTLHQVVSCSKNHKDGVKAKADHGSGVLSAIGKFVNFRLQDNKVVADLELLESEPDAAKIIEMARVMPDELGFSIAFDCGEEQIQGLPHARCSQLFSIDLVDQPAATRGIFTAKVNGEIQEFSARIVDISKRDMATIPATGDPKKEGHSKENFTSPTSEREIQPPAPNDSAQIDQIVAAVLAKLNESKPAAAAASPAAPDPEKEEGQTEDFKKDCMASSVGGATPTPAVGDPAKPAATAAVAPASHVPGSAIGQAIVDHVHAHLSDPTKANLKEFSAEDFKNVFLSTVGVKPMPLSATDKSTEPTKTLQEQYDEKKAEFKGSNMRTIQHFASKQDAKMMDALASNQIRTFEARPVYKSSFNS